MILTIPMLWFVCVEMWGILITNLLEIEPRFPRVLSSSQIFFDVSFFFHSELATIYRIRKRDSFSYENLVIFCHKTLSQSTKFSLYFQNVPTSLEYCYNTNILRETLKRSYLKVFKLDYLFNCHSSITIKLLRVLNHDIISTIAVFTILNLKIIYH